MKMLVPMRLILATSTLTTGLLFAQSPSAFKPGATPAKTPTKIQSTKSPDVGERKFQANCGRCHSAPDQLPPSITGTVVRHMRVRASLSAQDEKDILKFLAP
jgi:mono/diheme cytochrome c family protein